jgi:hypothetical protein
MIKLSDCEQKYSEEIKEKIEKYYKESPSAVKCVEYLMKEYPYVMPKIDHMAFRFLSKLDWEEFDKKIYDFSCCGRLDFPLKKDDKYYKHAHWYSHRLFSRIFTSYINILDEDKEMIENIYNSDMSKQEKYNLLKKIDQYLAWTYVWGEDINHIAFELSDYPDDFETILEKMKKELNLTMNKFGNDGTEIMISQDKLMKQASTKSDLVDGIPKAYIEFVDRSYDKFGNKRDGFDTFNANNIFESTDTK